MLQALILRGKNKLESLESLELYDNRLGMYKKLASVDEAERRLCSHAAGSIYRDAKCAEEPRRNFAEIIKI